MNEKFAKAPDQSLSRNFGHNCGSGYSKENVSSGVLGSVSDAQKTHSEEYQGVQSPDKSNSKNSGLRSGNTQVGGNFYPAFIYPVVLAITALLWWLFFSLIF